MLQRSDSVAMKHIASLFALALVATASSAQPALTIYNQSFAVVRERVPLDLTAGVNVVKFTGATRMLEPDSVVLRDPTGKVSLRVLEQSYRADTLSQGLLLSLNEGKELDFLVRDQSGRENAVRGKVIRSGYTPGGVGAESTERLCLRCHPSPNETFSHARISE